MTPPAKTPPAKTPPAKTPPAAVRPVARFFLLLITAVFAAAVFGALHNQASYAISPEYFTELKFDQFQVPMELRGPIGAAWVGVLASWSMGLLLGAPLAISALRADDWTVARRRFLGAIWRVLRTMLITIAVLWGLAYALDLPPPPDAIIPASVTDPVAFGHAARLHATSYLGALFGLVAAGVFLWRTGKSDGSRTEPA